MQRRKVMELSDFGRDGDGFLENLADWSPEFARLVAEDEGVDYNDDLDEVIKWAREFYAETSMAPRINDFSKGFYAKRFGQDAEGNTVKISRKEPVKYLAKLTNGSGMKRIDKIAGLPKPTGCV